MSRLIVPKELWSKAESLSGLGVEEFAWHPEDAAQVLELLRPTEIAVLGGDVYMKRAGRFEPTYESWYAARETHELPSAFATRSQSIAREYLANLMKSGGDERWVTLVLSEPMEPTEEDDLGSA
ncbi:Imm40 family immunity protein [Myxococcus sp. Y35]|uniref:Imm40 family immunity protein n=1 Tax=Pseudomyxococcus flavus TaxID=3115648 RepID=UPI003CEDE8C1